jgi:hypothetical protein
MNLALKQNSIMLKSEYYISKMDCPSEESMIRLKLAGLKEIRKLDFDIDSRRLVVYHSDENPDIIDRLSELNLGSTLVETVEYQGDIEKESNEVQSKLLWTVLAINFSFFLIEITAGLLSRSMGLVAEWPDLVELSSLYWQVLGSLK